jgi:hypothetical protein
MSEFLLQVIMALLLGAFIVMIGISLWRMHANEDQPDLTDLITAMDKAGKIRFDARKCFEAGAFAVSSWGFIYLTLAGKLTEWFFIGYMAAWTTARFLRDREQRLSRNGGSNGDGQVHGHSTIHGHPEGGGGDPDGGQPQRPPYKPG